MSPLTKSCGLLLALLCTLVASVRATDTPGDPPPAEGGYVGAQACKVCHNTAEKEHRWDTWMNTRHPDALTTLHSEASAKIAAKQGLDVPAWEAPTCLRCHVTAYDAAKGAAPARIAAADGVQCESCHGPGAEHVRDVQRAWIEKETGVDVGAHTDSPDKANCTACHNPESPTWNPARYALADGGTSGFDYAQAKKRAIHPETDKRVESLPR